MKPCVPTRLTLLVAVCLSGASALAQKASITLSCFPALSVADGHSQVTMTAEVRDLNGGFVRDGTPVIFETDKGSIRGKNVVETQNGFARVVLTAPGSPGTAKVRASVFSLNASATLEVDFVNDRSLLDAAKEFIEVTASEELLFATQDKVLEARGPNKGVVLRYRDIEVKADELQFKPTTYEVKARGAVLTVGKRSEAFRELSYRLNQRKGLGIVTRVETGPQVTRAGFGAAVSMVDKAAVDVFDLAASGSTLHKGEVNLSPLSFQDISGAMSIVSAKKAVVSPGRNVQFQKAAVKLGGQTVMSLPLFQVDMNTSSPVVTEQFLDVSNSSVAVNYPYYLSLGPGQSSALRFRYGNRYSSGLGATGGTYLDYEYAWNRGASMEGGLTVSGLARDDWGVGARQYWQPDSRTSVSAQLDLPAHRSFFTNLNLNRRLDGVQANLSYQHGNSLVGDRFRSDQLGLTLDGDPIAMGKLPAALTFGLTAQQRRITGQASEFSQGAGLQARVDSHTILVTPRDSLTFNYTVTRWAGTSGEAPLTQTAAVHLASNWANGLYIQTSYEYGQDGFSETVLGRHRLTLDGLYSAGKFNLHGFVTKGLDLDRLTANLNLDYKLDSVWRLSTGYYVDRYLGDTFFEQTFILGYRLGFREIGLSYSTRTKRVGLELLGTRFD